MAKPLSLEILPEELEELLKALEVWQKIRNGTLSTEPIIAIQTPSRAHSGGTSQIVQHRNVLGYHSLTTHRILMPDGTTPHWHGKDIRFGDVLLRRPDGSS
jgi:hypothetical protein